MVFWENFSADDFKTCGVRHYVALLILKVIDRKAMFDGYCVEFFSYIARLL